MFRKLKEPISTKESGKLIVVGLSFFALLLLFSFQPSTKEWINIIQNSQNIAKASEVSPVTQLKQNNSHGFFDLSRFNLKLPNWGSSDTTPKAIVPSPALTTFEQDKLKPIEIVERQPEPIATPREEIKPAPLVPRIEDVPTPKDGSKDFQNPKLQPVLITVKGKIRWEDTDQFKVLSDRFAINSLVNVKVGNKLTNLEVDNWRILDSEVAMIVNKQIFKELGGNPLKQQEIEATITTR